MDIYPGWWLTLAWNDASTADIDAVTTIIPVADAGILSRFLASNPDVLIDGETMHVLRVNTKQNTLTVGERLLFAGDSLLILLMFVSLPMPPNGRIPGYSTSRNIAPLIQRPGKPG